MASSFNLLGNPELDRILRINLPSRRILFIAGFALTIVLVITGLSWNDRRGYDYAAQLSMAGRDAYWGLTVVLFGLLFVLVPAMTAISFIQEKLRGTAIFQQMVLISPFQIAVGKFLGSGAVGYLMAIVIMPFAIAAAIFGNEKPENVLSLYTFLVVGGLSCQAVGLFVSSVFSAQTDKAIRGEMLIGPVVGVLSAALALNWSRYFYDNYYRGSSFYRWHFYGMDVPAYVAILGLMIFVGVWAFAGAVRRIKASQLVPTAPWPVWLFFITAEAGIVGLFWEWRYDLDGGGTQPISNLVLYLFINWAALVVLAGSISLSRHRLLEWWSAGHDPLGLFQRQEVRNNFKTFMIALAVAEGGLLALWSSYHLSIESLPPKMFLFSQLLPIAAGFALTILGGLAFVQYSAMQRFRAKGWAGVCLVVAFYLVMGVTGAFFENRNNTPALLNPAVYAYSLTKDDPYMDRTPKPHVNVPVGTYNTRYTPPVAPERPETGTLMLHGVLAQGLLALGCFGLAYLKWRKIQDEMLRA